ncbi:MAG TPA: hypothetical protein VJ859_02135 [Allosphingosinicella sp.]|nr:hypothetical protein [Allosphingosinicella sp.]
MIETVQQLGVDRYNIRKPDRVRIRLTTRLRVSGQPDMEISLCNISKRGFMAESGAGVMIGSDALLYLPGIGWTLANIRWSLGNRFGARFADAINMRQFWRANPPKRISYLDERPEAA